MSNLKYVDEGEAEADSDLFLVYFDEEEAENAREHPPASDDRPEQEGQGTRLPIVGSVVAVTESVRARMTSGAKT